MNYKQSGVDIDAGKKAVEDIVPLVKSTYTNGVIDNFGLFGSLFSLEGMNYKNPVLVSGTDGVGTKLKVAFAAGKHDTIGIDLVAMSVNDIACLGAKPLFFLDYISTSKLKPDVIKEIIAGIARGCKLAGCALLGGEMAEMPSFYKNDEYDIAGFAVGIVEKDEIINGSTISEGDGVIGVVSSGLHSNGYSLARKIVFDMMKLKTDDAFLSDGRTVKDALLEPTIIYSALIKDLRDKFRIKGIAHITGGGLIENIPRVIPQGFEVEIWKDSWKMPELFSILEKEGELPENELFRVFNAGIGLSLIIEEKDVSEVLKFINDTVYENSTFFKSYKIGRIVASSSASGEPRVNLL